MYAINCLRRLARGHQLIMLNYSLVKQFSPYVLLTPSIYIVSHITTYNPGLLLALIVRCVDLISNRNLAARSYILLILVTYFTIKL